MLSLCDIVKTYTTGDTTMTALRQVSIDFRESEFVSILGPSGCGKTTLLNVIGGLDRYDSGDLVINGRSTKEYKDADWDTYRNHSIGFVFQSYNLIMHQTVLSNVELALTLSGVSREERRARAVAALTQVGLGDQIGKKPNQMSGGQMQRVAIARALVNDPDILLADEPTGALDTATSVQIMEILKKVSETKLVVMVTHNPDLAAQYSTRIIRLLDGQVTDDTNPFTGGAAGGAGADQAGSAGADQVDERVVSGEEIASAEEVTSAEEAAPEEEATSAEEVAPKAAAPAGKRKKSGKGKRSMSFFTALSLSFNNLLTKKTRTLLVSVAGSIGIIGIALILALSNGVSLFIEGVQEDTLASYPISITSQTSDYSAILAAMVGTRGDAGGEREPNTVRVDDSVSNMFSAMTTMQKNNLGGFDEYLRAHYDEIKEDLTAIQYSYNMRLQIFNGASPYKEGALQVSPAGVLSDLSGQYGGLSGIFENISIFSEIMPGRDGDDLINPTVREQYEVVDGRWPEAANELVLVTDRAGRVSNITLYILGLCDPDELTAMMASMMLGEEYKVDTSNLSFTYRDFYDLDLNLAYNSDFYAKTGEHYEIGDETLPLWGDLREGADFLPDTVYENGMKLEIVGIVCPAKDATSTSIQGSIGYTSALTDAVLGRINDSEVVKQQVAHPTHSVFSGLPFVIDDADTLPAAEKKEKLENYFSHLDNAGKAKVYTDIRTHVSDEKMAEYLASVKETFSTAEDQREFLINLYAFNSQNGSLEVGTFANRAVAAILYAVDGSRTMDEYETLIATQYAAAFELDGEEVSEDGAGKEVWARYAGLIDKLYSTPEKLEQAFNTMTALTVRSIYPMVEGINIQKDLLSPTAPHFVSYLAQMNEDYPEDSQKIGYLTARFCALNGVAPTDSLAMAYVMYLNSLGGGDALAAEFTKGASSDYGTRLSADAGFRNDATAALFEAYLAGLSEEEYAALYADHMEKSDTSYEDNLQALGASVGYDALTAINIYPVDFEAKERLTQVITDYNNTLENEEDKITYTDLVALMMSSVTIIINAITYVLIAFVSISLVVSSIMIGIITYISVLERTKEIGILRAIGASKRDISRVFNAETLIIGFAAGAIGIIVTLVLCLPINLILRAVTDMNNIRAVLPVAAGFILVAISMALTLIAGLIPSRIAAKKDPVVALRTE